MIVCEGCLIQGFGPHDCRQEIIRGEGENARPFHCICALEPTCYSWAPAS